MTRTNEVEPPPIPPEHGLTFPERRPRRALEPGRPTMEDVVGTDDRTDVTDVTAWPWRAVCSIVVVGASSVRSGTGWFLGPNTVITAGHVLTGFSGAMPAPDALEITVRPGRTGERSPFGRWSSRSWTVTTGWRASRAPGSDLGAIFLRDNPGAAVGSLGVDRMPGGGVRITVVGYPDLGGAAGGRQLMHTDAVQHRDGTRLYYAADTSEGESGGPILAGDPTEGIVVGIHGYGFEGLPEDLRGHQWNSGVEVSDGVLAQLKAWRT